MTGKKKVLFCIHALGGGGAEKVLINLVSGLDRSKYDITLLTVVNSGIYVEQIPDDVRHISLFSFHSGDRTVGVSKDGSFSGSLLARAGRAKRAAVKLYEAMWKVVSPSFLYKLCVREEYDIEVAFLEGPCTKLISGSRNRSSRKVAWIHVDVAQEGKSHRFYRSVDEERRTYGRFNQIVAVSEGVRASAARYLGVPECAIEVLRNPVDIEEVRRKASDTPQGGLPSSRGPVFCAIGRLCPQKAFDRLIEASAALREEGYVFTVWILGEGPDQQALVSSIGRSGLEGVVRLLGYKSNPFPFMAASDAFVCSSLAEGFSTTATEAAALGKPIVTTDCAGMADLARLYDAVRLVENSTAGVVEGMRALLDAEVRLKGSFSDEREFSMSSAIDKIQEAVLDVR